MANKTANKSKTKQIKTPKKKKKTPIPVNIGRDRDPVVIVEKQSTKDIRDISVKKAPKKHQNRVKVIHK